MCIIKQKSNFHFHLNEPFSLTHSLNKHKKYSFILLAFCVNSRGTFSTKPFCVFACVSKITIPYLWETLLMHVPCVVSIDKKEFFLFFGNKSRKMRSRICQYTTTMTTNADVGWCHADTYMQLQLQLFKISSGFRDIFSCFIKLKRATACKKKTKRFLKKISEIWWHEFKNQGLITCVY